MYLGGLCTPLKYVLSTDAQCMFSTVLHVVVDLLEFSTVLHVVDDVPEFSTVLHNLVGDDVRDVVL